MPAKFSYSGPTLSSLANFAKAKILEGVLSPKLSSTAPAVITRTSDKARDWHSGLSKSSWRNLCPTLEWVGNVGGAGVE